MRIFSLTGLGLATAILAGCATSTPECTPGSTHPSCVPKQAAVPAGESPEQQAQIALAEQSLAAAMNASKPLPASLRARNPQIKTTSAPLADSRSGRVYEFKVLDSASLEMPLAGKGKRGYVEAMDEIKDLANQLADARGAVTISVDQATADVKARRVNTKSGSTQTQAGNTVTVEKVSSGSVPRGVERYTIKPSEVTAKP